MQRIIGLPDEQVLIYEAQAEAALRAALADVMDKIARRIEASAPILASALSNVDIDRRRPGEAQLLVANGSALWSEIGMSSSRTSVLVAADGVEDQGDEVLPSSVPEGDGLPPGQPYVSPDDLTSIPPFWHEQVVSDLAPIIAQVFLDAAGRTQANMVEISPWLTGRMPAAGSLAAERYLAQVENTFDQIGDTLWAQARSELTAGFEAGESIPQLAERLRQSANVTARTGVLVARTQVNEASNAGSFETARASGLQMQKEWIATPDLRTRPTHLAADGQRVDLNEPFIVGGFSAMFPAAPTLPPAERYSCRCTIGYVMPDRAPAQVRADDLATQQLEDLPGTTSPIDDLAATQSARLQAIIDEQHAQVEGVIEDVHRRFDERFGRQAGPGIDLPARGENPPGYIRPSLREAKTPRQLRRVWQDEVEQITGFPFVVDAMPRGISMVTAREYAEGTLQMFAQFPAAKVDRIHWFDDAASSSYAQVRRGGHAIEFNMRYASEAGRPKFLAARRRDVAGWDDPALSTSWGVRNDLSGQGVVYHEFTHILDIENGREAIHGQIVPLLIRHAQTEGITDIDDLIKRRISSYATKNYQEMVAEAGTDVMVNGAAASQLSRDIFDLVRAEYRRRGFEIRTAPALPEDLGDVFPKAAAPRALSTQTVAQLRALAKERGIAIPAGARKADLVKALEEGPAAPRVAVSFDDQAARAAKGADAADAAPLSIERNDAASERAFRAATDDIRPGMHFTPYEAVTRYRGVEFDHIQDTIRADEVLAGQDPFVEAIDVAMGASPLRSDVLVYRGMSERGFLRESGLGLGDDLTGATYRARPYTSTATDEAIGRGYANKADGGVFVRVLVPRDTGAISLPGGEAELLLQRGLTFRIVADRGVEKFGRFQHRVLDVEVVPKVAPIDEKALLRAAARERNRLIESSQGTAKLLAEVDELIANKASKVAIHQRLDPALIAPEQVFAGADPAIVEALRTALGTGDPAKLRSALTRAGTKSKLKPIGKAGAKTKYDAETMEGVGGIDIPAGAQITVVRRGTTLTLPDGSTMQLTRAQVTPIAVPVKAAKAVRAAKRVPPAQVEPSVQGDQTALDQLARRVKSGKAERIGRDTDAIVDRITFPDRSSMIRKSYDRPGKIDPATAAFRADAEELGALVARTVDVRAPVTSRAGLAAARQRDMIFMEDMKGVSGREAGLAAVTEDDRRKVGLLDLLIGQSDRNTDNWLIDDSGHIVVIDHGRAFLSAYNRRTRRGVPSEDSWFTRPFTRRRSGDAQGYEIADSVDLAPEDLAIVRARLESLASDFERLGRADWHRQMLDDLAALERAATPGAKRLGLSTAETPKPAPAKVVKTAPEPTAPTGRVAPGPAYETRMRDIRRLEKAPETKPPRQLGGGSTSDVTLLTRADGQVVEKVYGRRVPGTKAAVAKEVDAEELAPLVVQEFGVRAAATARTGADRVIMEFVDGETFIERFPGHRFALSSNTEQFVRPFTDSDEGRLLGLADYVMGNTDRNEGNWIIRTVDGQREIVAIDHGYAFSGLRGIDPPAGFFGEFLQDRAAGYALRAQVDVNPADLRVIRQRLEGLRQRFVESGRKTWHDAMMRRLRALEQRADPSAPIRLATT